MLLKPEVRIQTIVATDFNPLRVKSNLFILIDLNPPGAYSDSPKSFLNNLSDSAAPSSVTITDFALLFGSPI